MMKRFSEKLKLLLWKNYILRRHHWIVTILELLLPVLLCVCIAVLNVYAFSTSHDISTFHNEENDPIPLISEDIIYSCVHTETVILYTPVNSATEEIMQYVSREINGRDIVIIPKSSEVEIEYVYKQIQQNYSREDVFGIVFESTLMKSSKIMNYTIRSSSTYDTSALFTNAYNVLSSRKYMTDCFLALQLALEKSFMKFVGKESSVMFFVQDFPSLAISVKDGIRDLLYFATVFSFIFLCPALLKRIIEEKSSGAKELMKLMGLPSLMLWFGWFLHAIVVTVISVTIICLVLTVPFKANAPVLLTSGLVLFIFLLLFCCAAITSLFAISAFFKRPTLGMIFGILVWVGSYIGASVIRIGSTGRVYLWHWLLIAVFPNFGLYSGYNAIFHYENRDVGMYFLDVFSSSMKFTSQIQFATIWIVFAVQSCMYFILTLYLEAVFPGNYGISKPWYFPFTCFLQYVIKKKPVQDITGNCTEDGESFEPLAASLPIGISIQGLRKVFGSIWSRETKVAVDGVSLNICKGQITALLGHNGAGKTTTMMILTGMLEPTSGTVYINDYDASYQISKIRENLGFCPQHNLLFSDFTVLQHLTFYAMLKGCSDVKTEVQTYIECLNLKLHVTKRPSELSGGYKRRLCLAIAFIGGSKIVILDEPTSGLDPEARREIWDLLLSMRGERTILVTTHFMEEADVLGDRIAIMDHGQVQCYGTSMFLKKHYGTGYVLSVQKDISYDENEILNSVRSVIPDADVKSTLPSLVTFRLPAHQTKSFPALFSVLQEDRDKLGLKSVGISITTMEEVFLRVGEIALESSKKNDDCLSESTEKSEGSLPLLSPSNVKGIALYFQQIEALIMKRVQVMNWNFLFMAAMQVLVIIFVMWISVYPHGANTVPPLQLHLSMYGSTNVLLQDSQSPEKLTALYKDLITHFGSTVEIVPLGSNVIDSLENKEKELKEDYTWKYIVAAKFNNSEANVVALHSQVAMHSLPISLNLLTNAVLKYQMNDSMYSMSVTNHPFQKEEGAYNAGEVITLVWMSLVPLTLTFWMGLFTFLPLHERVSGSKQLQQMTGVKVPLYWLTLFMTDIVLHLIVTLLMVLAIAAVDAMNIFSTTIELSNFCLIFLLYGISAIPFSYLVSYWKDTWAGCFAVLVIINLITGIILRTLVLVLEPFNSAATNSINSVMQLVPNYALTYVLQIFVAKVVEEKSCLFWSALEKRKICTGLSYSPNMWCCACEDASCYTSSVSYMKLNQTMLLYLGLTSLLYLGLIFCIDWGYLQLLWEKLVAKLSLPFNMKNNIGDDDVEKEAQFVKTFFSTKNVDTGSDLVVYDLKKKYGLNRKPPTLKGVSFQVKAGECFGLLGVNGAGKTTTFKILTGAVAPTTGCAIIGRYRLDIKKSEYLAQIGYCPQQDALIECLSGRKLLRLFGSLRGVPRHVLDAEVDKWINIMGLQECENRCSGDYSGGNKRKLSTAMALIGNPPLVFLDEPTCGVDPVARRNLWNILIALQKSGESIVLTSHSMEECEVLCNRLAIMASGQLVCIGSIPHLKTKFQQGATIKIKIAAGLESGALQNIKNQVENAFVGCTLKDEHKTLLHYQVKDSSWGKMFEIMEKMKMKHEVLEDYSISETSLEEVFLSFAQN